MADHEDGEIGDGIPRNVHDLIGQLYGVTEKLAGLTGVSGIPGVGGLPGVGGIPGVGALPGLAAFAESLPGASAMPSVPRPAALSAAQLKAVVTTVAAQRRGIEAMQAQLRAFDEQLVVMEKILEPLAEWTTVWADLERKMTGTRSAPTSDASAEQ